MGDYLDLEKDPRTWIRRYAARGIKMVVLYGLNPDLTCSCPKGKDCRATGKHPVRNNWATTASDDPAAIEPSFDNGTPRNLGLAMGHGLVALDVDGQAGLESLDQLITEHEEFGDLLASSPVHKTGSGGFHVIFRTREDFKNTVKLLPGLDIRSLGGQIVACPSRHKSGRHYDWQDTWGEEFPELPEWLADLFRGTTESRFDVYAWLEKQPPAIQTQNGSGRLMAVMRVLIRKARVRTVEQALRVIRSWNERCVPPWSDQELERGFTNAMIRFEQEAVIDLPVRKDGSPICNISTVTQVLTEDARYSAILAYNEFDQKVYWRGAPLLDHHVTEIRQDIHKRYGIEPSKELVWDLVCKLSKGDNVFDPVRTYFESLKWDGKERVADIARDIVGVDVEDQPLASEFFVKTLRAAVARTFEPGQKADTVCTLQGFEGLGKSRFWDALATPWFCDTPIDVNSKDAFIQLGRFLIYELAEVESVYPRAEQGRIKSFFSSRSDTFRPPYARVADTFPRRGIIVGSTNIEEVLRGREHRRWWIVQVRQHIDIKMLKALRDQLWAETVIWYRGWVERGSLDDECPWWLTDEREALRRQLMGCFERFDPTEERVYEWLEGREEGVSWDEIVVNALTVDERMRMSNAIRDSIINALHKRAFTKYRSIKSGQRGIKWKVCK